MAAPSPARRFVLACACAAAVGSCNERSADSPPSSASSASRGPFYFTDVSPEAGFDELTQATGHKEVDYIVDAKGVGGAWLDYDDDGDPDFYLAQGAFADGGLEGPPDQLFRNDGDPDGDGVPTFTEVTEQAGLGDRQRTYGVAVADYDNDGDADVYLSNLGANKLYRNDGDGTFTEIGAAAGVADEGFGVNAIWGDTDRDGDLDLFVTNYLVFDFDRYPARGEQPANKADPCMWHGVAVYCGPRNLVPAKNVFFRNDGDADGDGIPRFTDATREVGLDAEPSYGLQAHFFDADDDGDDDLYVANDSLANSFFVNRDDGTFEDRSLDSGLAYNEQGHEQGSMGIATGDYDGDGDLDVAVTNFSHDHDTLYRNEGGNLFTDVSYPAGLGVPSYLRTGFAAVFADVDQDGWEDLLVSYGHVYPQVDQIGDGTKFRQRNGLFRNNRDGTIEEVEDGGPGWGIVKAHRAFLPVDLDGDGDVDLAVTSLDDRPSLLRNDGATGAWLQVQLRGRASNRDGIGARVTIVAGGRSQFREVRRTTLWEGSTLPIAHFGLGAAASVERLEVRWPSGRTSKLERVPANQRLTVVEPDAEPSR